MKKTLLCVLTIICIFALIALPACKSGGEKKLDEKSEIVSVSLKLNDGYTTVLNEADGEFIKEQILSLGEFIDDSKILVASKWDYEYDYTFKITFRQKKLFKTTETVLYYRFGTTGIYTDSSGKITERRFDNEWTFLTSVGARRIADTTDERAAAIRERMDSAVASERKARYDEMKQVFSDYGYSVRELGGNELFSFENPFETGTFLVPDASAGFEAKKSESDCFYVYYCDVKTAKKLFDTLNGACSCYSDVFFGFSRDPSLVPFLKEVFDIQP